MIKINLLPANIFTARTIKRLIALFAVVLVLIVAAGFLYKSSIDKQTAELKAQYDVAARLLAEKQSADQETGNLQAANATTTARVEFFQAVEDYNLKYPALFEAVARMTYRKVYYTSLTPVNNGTGLTMTAYAPSLTDAGRYLLNMYRGHATFSAVSISGVPGFPAGDAGAAGSGMPAPSMGPTTMPTSMPTPAPISSTGSSGGFGTMPTPIVGPPPGWSPSVVATPEVQAPGMPTPGIGIGAGGGGGYGGGSYGGGGYGGLDAITQGLMRGAETRKGLHFSVTVVLKNPLVPPTPAGAVAQDMSGGMGMGLGLPQQGAAPAAPVAPGGGDDDAGGGLGKSGGDGE